MDEILNLAKKGIDLYYKYPNATVLVGLWLFLPLMTWAAVQRVKKVAPLFCKRRLNNREVSGIAFVIAITLTFLVGASWSEVPYNSLAVHALLMAIILPYAVGWWMEWAKKHNEALWHALRADKRSKRHASTPPDRTDSEERRKPLDMDDTTADF